MLFGNSVWHAKAAWGIWVGEGNPSNAAGMIDVPCSFRAELAAILNCVEKAADPIRFVGDCQGALNIFSKLLEGDPISVSRGYA